MADDGVVGTLKYEKLLAVFGEGLVEAGIVEWLEAFEYQGFDPRETHKEMCKRAADKGLSVKMLLSIIIKIVTVAMKRGTAFKESSFKEKSKDKAKAAEFQDLCKEWNVLPKLGAQTGPEVVTISRLVITYAEIAAALLMVRAANPIASDDRLELWMCFPASVGLFTETEWNEKKDAYLDNMVKFARIINKKNTNLTSKTDENIRAEQMVYAENARSSDFNKATRKFKRATANAIAASLAAKMKEKDKAEHPYKAIPNTA